VSRILIVEDDPAVLRGLKDNLTFEAYEVLTAVDGEHAYRLIRDEQPDLVLMDVMLPGMWGSELCRRVRAEGVTTPIVMLTARGEESDRVLGLDLGADDYIGKPFGVRELCARIRTILRNRQNALGDHGRLERDLRSAADVQRTLFPRAKPAVATLDCAGLCRPALSVGGDYFDYVPVGDGRVALVVADVAGKGMPAALVMASLHGLIRAQAAAIGGRVDELAQSINTLLYRESGRSSYATLFYGVYDAATGVLEYVNAGHPPPFVLTSRDGDDGGAMWLDATSPPAGLFDRIEAGSRRVRLRPSDWLVVCSDGVTEAVNAAGEELGRETVLGTVRHHVAARAEAMCEAVLDAVAAHQGAAPQYDDVTVLAARIEGSES
jgi:sigma-B regulation protein RsbU (phosphoserine phosphatase)